MRPESHSRRSSIPIVANAIWVQQVRWGITPAPIIPLLVERIGPRAAGRFALTGERFDAATARRIGLVQEVCPTAELEAVAERFVDHLLIAGPEAVAITKPLIAEAAETPFTGEFHDRIVDEAAQCEGRRGPGELQGKAPTEMVFARLIQSLRGLSTGSRRVSR